MKKPLWVRVGLWGVKSRTIAIGFMWVCYISGIIAALYGIIWDGRYFGFSALVIAGAWYQGALRWNDVHDGWNR